jgi:4-methyl-5(b-hydroxyethyl)-thiazole monophosphate biosynthesis
MSQTVLIPLAPGFEEIEAVTLIDVLRRAGVQVSTCSLGSGLAERVSGAHGIEIQADASLGEIRAENLRAIVLPGGLPGATNLQEDEVLRGLLQSVHRAQGLVAAICAAPIVLGSAGLLEGLQATCYPGFEDGLIGAEVLTGAPVVRAGRVWTSRGPGTAMEFALALAAEFAGQGQADELRAGMLVS